MVTIIVLWVIAIIIAIVAILYYLSRLLDD